VLLAAVGTAQGDCQTMSNCGCGSDFLYVNNDNAVWLRDLYNGVNNEGPIEDAEVVGMLKDSDGNDVFLIPMPFDVELGFYVGTIQHTIPLVAGDLYSITVTASVAGGLVGQWLQTYRAAYRT